MDLDEFYEDTWEEKKRMVALSSKRHFINWFLVC